MKLIIQIPCYNEEKTLPVAFNDLPKAIPGVDAIEYLIIDDGSTDSTVKVAEELGVDHVVSFKQNRGLAAGFMAGIDACLRLGADIIVNTDADNQYCGADIEKIVKPILENKTDIVIGSRPIDEIEDFTKRKKFLQHLGSRMVRMVSNTDVPDVPSGFRAYSREAALRLNVLSRYSYTLETIIQAGRNNTAMTSVPIRTNPELRESRLAKGMMHYIGRSAVTIMRSFMMYNPMKFFFIIGGVIFLAGLALDVRFVLLLAMGYGSGHVQSLILSAILVIFGFLTIIVGLLADLISANRKLLEDIQYHVRKLEYDSNKINTAAETEKGNYGGE